MHVGLGLNLGVGLTVGRAAAAYAYNYVVFDGVNDKLTNGTNLGLAASNTYTFACAFRCPSLAASHQIVGVNAGGAAMLEVVSTGAININGPFAPGGLGTTGHSTINIAAGTIVEGNTYVIHVAADHVSDTVGVWLNGNPVSFTGGTFAGTNFGVPTSWQIGGTALSFGQVTLGLVWFDVGQYITAPSAFFPARSLGTNMATPGARPAIGFGDAQVAANWNAGTNLGDGTGTWSMAGETT